MFGLKNDWSLEVPPRYFTLDDYEGAVARWCPGCGDHAVLTAVQRICREEQIPPEKIVTVAGIGCSGRFPHYMGTYGFHGLHGRALPVACGIKSRRPDLTVWVATGDGDCCSIGAGHWLHAIRYNMDIKIMMFDNNIYGLTKNQTSPTTRPGEKTNTHPHGSWLPALDPISATLGMTNASFVAQTVDWNPIHLYETLYAAYRHKGTSFIRILQRCPTYTKHIFEKVQSDPNALLLMQHTDGVRLDEKVSRMFPQQVEHDPSDMLEARRLAARTDVYPIGVFYRNPELPRYDEYTAQGVGTRSEDILAALRSELDRYSV